MAIKVNSNRILEAAKIQIDKSSVIVVDQIASAFYEMFKDMGLVREADAIREHWRKQWSEKI